MMVLDLAEGIAALAREVIFGNQPVSNIVVDTRLEAYESFFDHDWAKTFGRSTDSSKLSQPGMDLCREWKGAALVSRMPWLMIESLQSFHNGYTHRDPSFLHRLTRTFSGWLVRDTGLSNMRKKELQAKIDELGAAVQRGMVESIPVFSREEAWSSYMKVLEFGLSLWSSQRICYCAVYYAYENFVQRCVAVGKGDSAYRSFRIDILRTDFANYFGRALMDECLAHSEIEVARLARNCLAHNGGRASPELLATGQRFRIEGGEIHVFPKDVRGLFDFLKMRALKIADHAKQVLAYQ